MGFEKVQDTFFEALSQGYTKHYSLFFSDSVTKVRAPIKKIKSPTIEILPGPSYSHLGAMWVFD